MLSPSMSLKDISKNIRSEQVFISTEWRIARYKRENMGITSRVEGKALVASPVTERLVPAIIGW